MAGVIGLKSEEAFNNISLGLETIQHRGQESFGISLYKDKIIRKRGPLSNLSSIRKEYLTSKIGVGVVKNLPVENLNPFNYENISLVRDGEITNRNLLKEYLNESGIKTEKNSDEELMIKILAEALKEEKDIPEAVKKLMKTVEGAYSVTALIDDELVSFRDPHGIKPLVWGKNKSGNNCFSSESCALDILDYKLIRDVNPGELVINNETFNLVNKGKKICMFEYVYISRPDSIIEGKSVYDVRLKLGENLE